MRSRYLIFVTVTVASLTACSSTVTHSSGAPAANSGSQTPVSTGMTTFICAGSTQATLLQWTDDNGNITGTYTVSDLSGTAPDEDVSSDNGYLSGTLSGTAVTLDTGFQQPLYGSLSGGTLTLNVPQSDGSYEPGTCNSGTLSDWNSVVGGLNNQARDNNGTALQQEAQASQASANAGAQQQAQNALTTLQGFSLSSDLRTLAGDVTQTNSDLAAEKTAAAAGPNADGGNCYNLIGNVSFDARSGVEYDAQNSFGYDLRYSLVPDISSGRQAIGALQSDLSNLTSMGLPAPSGAQEAITSAQNMIRNAISTANSEVSQVNADVSSAYAVSNSMATGNCAGDGAGTAPSPIRDIS